MKYITLPNRHKVTLGEYVRSWKLLQTLEPDTEVNGFEWFPARAADILQRISEGIQHRINRHLPIRRETTRSDTALLLRRIEAGKIQRQCKWCGQTYTAKQVNDCCCSPDCLRDYRF